MYYSLFALDLVQLFPERKMIHVEANVSRIDAVIQYVDFIKSTWKSIKWGEEEKWCP